MENDETRVLFSVQITSLNVKVKALKKLLNDDQLAQYNHRVAKGKDDFLAIHPDSTDEMKKIIDTCFS